jgi:O-antigen/teichoic acid export membrane protein
MANLIADNRLWSRAKLSVHIRTPLYRNAYALMISTAVSSMLGLIYWVLAARLYSAEMVGLNAAAISGMTFLAGVAQLNLMNVMHRFVPSAGRATARFVGYAYLTGLVTATIISAIFLLGIDLWSPSLRFLISSPWFILWFMLGVATWCIFNIQDSVMNGLRQSIWVPVDNISYGIAKILLLGVFVAAFAEYGIFASWTAPLLFALVAFNVLIFRRLIPRHVAENAAREEPLVLSEIIRYVIGNYIGSLFNLTTTRLLPVIVLGLAGAAANAYFFLPWTVATALKLTTTNMVSSLTVEGVNNPAKLQANSYRSLIMIALLLIPAVVVILISARWILSLSGHRYAAQGEMLLRLLTLSTIPSTITTVYLGMARVRRQVGGIMAVQALLCSLILGLSYLFIQRYGITGVGWAALISEMSVAAILIAVHYRTGSQLGMPQDEQAGERVGGKGSFPLTPSAVNPGEGE